MLADGDSKGIDDGQSVVDGICWASSWAEMMALTMDTLKQMGIHLAVTLANLKQKDSRMTGYLAHQTLTALLRAEHMAVIMVVMLACVRLMDSTMVLTTWDIAG